LLGLGFELLSATLLAQYLQATDAVFYLQLGGALARWGVPGVALSFCFDELSAFFLSILMFALVVCFFFLIEYFEFDAQASSIIFLSALFSQAALLYFSVFDLCLLIFFWEVISLVSFLLVQHWAFRLVSFKAGMKVFTVSQFGDLPLFLFLFLILARLGSADLAEILGLLPTLSFEYLALGGVLIHLTSLLGLLLQVAVFLKAAQWFFYP
jgi:NADH-quinone oxidoreductase subunit L